MMFHRIFIVTEVMKSKGGTDMEVDMVTEKRKVTVMQKRRDMVMQKRKDMVMVIKVNMLAKISMAIKTSIQKRENMEIIMVPYLGLIIMKSKQEILILEQKNHQLNRAIETIQEESKHRRLVVVSQNRLVESQTTV